MILSDLESNNQIVGKNTATIVLSQPNNLQMFYYVSDKSKFHIQHEDSILQQCRTWVKNALSKFKWHVF